MKPSLVFFGTDPFAATVLDSLVASAKFNIVAAVTQPDRPTGRKQTLTKTAVKIVAEKNKLSVLDPEKLKDGAVVESIPRADVAVVCVYGLIIPQAVLDRFTYGTVNIHPSLLPKYRGPSPVQSALLNGETKTGISIMLIDAEMDHGPVLMQKEIPLNGTETAGELMTAFAPIGAEMLISSLEQYLGGSLKPIEQDHAKATYCKLLNRDDGRVDWTCSAQKIYNKFRGFTPWPGIWTTLDGKRVKLLSVKPSDKKIASGKIEIENERLLVGTQNNSLEIQELQFEGGTVLSANEAIKRQSNLNGNSFI